MPKKPVDYSKCMFYRLVCRDPTVKEVYVGHTTSEVDRRRLHKSDCHNEKGAKFNLFVYRFIRDHGGFENWQLIVHEKRAVEDVIAARLRERHWIEIYKATLNKQVPSRTHAESCAAYYAKHREDKKITSAVYRADHRDDKKISSAAYRAANQVRLKEKHECACGGCYTSANKSCHFKSNRHLAYQATL
jgi:hypothetical protein